MPIISKQTPARKESKSAVSRDVAKGGTKEGGIWLRWWSRTERGHVEDRKV